MKVFGYVVYPHIPKEKRGKLDRRAFAAVFVGYTESTKQYRVLNPIDNTVQIASSVKFDESRQGRSLFAEKGSATFRSIKVDSPSGFDHQEGGTESQGEQVAPDAVNLQRVAQEVIDDHPSNFDSRESSNSIVYLPAVSNSSAIVMSPDSAVAASDDWVETDSGT